MNSIIDQQTELVYNSSTSIDPNNHLPCYTTKTGYKKPKYIMAANGKWLKDGVECVEHTPHGASKSQEKPDPETAGHPNYSARNVSN